VADTIRTVEGYADCIVLRHFQSGSAKRAAAAASVPIINAGDGAGQHPTQACPGRWQHAIQSMWLVKADLIICATGIIVASQALLDVYTIKREIGRLENFSIGLVGDLANGRTVRSLAYLLSMYPGVKMYFVAPEVVRMKEDIKDYLTRLAA
jgi:aspartate carbamoyltransferase catalytic subunit